jgi:hypothetical protein
LDLLDFHRFPFKETGLKDAAASSEETGEIEANAHVIEANGRMEIVDRLMNQCTRVVVVAEEDTYRRTMKILATSGPALSGTLVSLVNRATCKLRSSLHRGRSFGHVQCRAPCRPWC